MALDRSLNPEPKSTQTARFNIKSGDFEKRVTKLDLDPLPFQRGDAAVECSPWHAVTCKARSSADSGHGVASVTSNCDGGPDSFDLLTCFSLDLIIIIITTIVTIIIIIVINYYYG